MKKISTALYIGRFQPFHLGHLDAVKQILQKCERILIVVGSAEDSYLSDNPFTVGERISMIDEALRAEKIEASSYMILPVRNIDNYALWTAHVQMYCPYFDVVFSGSEIVRGLFESCSDKPVFGLDFNFEISATRIRNAIKANDSAWQKMVSQAVLKQIEKINGVERVKICE
jgi:nicotinamide-nucleotide adenylyltransferase